MIYHRFLEMLNEDCFDNVMIELTAVLQKRSHVRRSEQTSILPIYIYTV